MTELLIKGNQAHGVRYTTPHGEQTLTARLVIGADGRHSTVRTRAWLAPVESDAPMDVLWFRISREDDDQVPFVSVGSGFTIVAVDRGSYWQLAYCIPKGEYDHLRTYPTSVVADRIRQTIPNIVERFTALQR